MLNSSLCRMLRETEKTNGEHAMDLNEYLWRYGIRQKDFADEVGLSQRTISLFVSRMVSPSLENAIKIVELTDGEVTFKELVKRYMVAI